LKKIWYSAYKIGSRLNVISARTYNFPFVKPLFWVLNTIESIQFNFDKHNIPVALLHTTNLYLPFGYVWRYDSNASATF
jgi:N-acetylneuraminate synthase